MHSDQRQPGLKVNRPIVKPSSRTTSTVVLRLHREPRREHQQPDCTSHEKSLHTRPSPSVENYSSSRLTQEGPDCFSIFWEKTALDELDFLFQVDPEVLQY